MSQYNNQNQIPGNDRNPSSISVNVSRSKMSQYNKQNQIPVCVVAYPPPVSATAYVAPPPVGYPTRDGQQPAQNAVPIETKTKGDGFWKGCCAALCCCCVLDACC
ncbi:protein CYSTEINE-RICH TRANSMEMBRANE MODULE 3 isoform X5 [Rhodamnia argentea]|uniref:Protein CYSTEINE-RICH TRANSMEMBRANE MODULE 3 isoform X5 n=1 Tax=Rhodamnia argentea TaxID=178133 RepID=A0ABM3HZE3_9MYRT|nr:protein CYSTEINE-RICH TRANSMEMBRANE MODULE 3 isoform X5 [Rhodamnia argentea]